MRVPIKPTPPDSPALSELLRRLVAAYDPERVYLFGSVARGEAGPDSDYDLMIIVADDAAPEKRQSRLAYQAMRGTGTAADVLVWPKSCFERRRQCGSVLAGDCPTGGKAALLSHDPGVGRRDQETLTVGEILFLCPVGDWR
jgi:hypothetical protein